MNFAAKFIPARRKGGAHRRPQPRWEYGGPAVRGEKTTVSFSEKEAPYDLLVETLTFLSVFMSPFAGKTFYFSFFFNFLLNIQSIQEMGFGSAGPSAWKRTARFPRKSRPRLTGPRALIGPSSARQGAPHLRSHPQRSRVQGAEQVPRPFLREESQSRASQENARLRRRTQEAPHSSQCRSVNVQRFVIATIRREWKPVVIEGQQYVLRLPDEEGNVQAETSEMKIQRQGKPR